MFTTLIVFINKKFSMNMRQFKVLLLFIAFSCSVFAQDRLSLFIGRANKHHHKHYKKHKRYKHHKHYRWDDDDDDWDDDDDDD